MQTNQYLEVSVWMQIQHCQCQRLGLALARVRYRLPATDTVSCTIVVIGAITLSLVCLFPLNLRVVFLFDLCFVGSMVKAAKMQLNNYEHSQKRMLQLINRKYWDTKLVCKTGCDWSMGMISPAMAIYQPIKFLV